MKKASKKVKSGAGDRSFYFIVTAVLILCAVLIYRPSKRFASLETEEADK